MSNYDDSELVKRLQKDDVKSFDIIYLKYHQALYANIYSLTKEAEVSQDILQEVFISLWEKRMTITRNSRVANWLFTVSYNKSVNYLKKALKEAIKLKSLQEGLDVAEDAGVSLREMQLDLIETAVKNLSPQKSKVFNLCKLQGKTYDETAKELNISKNTVKEYLVEAVIIVKDYVRQHPESSSAFVSATLFLLGM